jgi:putative two-component system response regulator
MKTIFVVDDNSVNLLKAENALSNEYNVVTLASAELMFEALEKVKPELILLDIIMPWVNGFDALGRLKANPEYKDIPVIFLTSKTDADTKNRGFEMGVVDFITKPFSEELLLRRVNAQSEKEGLVNG